MSAPRSSDGPRLVAHRGWISRHPENTLPALTAALSAGARWLEIDVQLSAQGTAHLFHDRTLARTTGREGTLGDLSDAELAGLDAGETDRFGERFAATPLPTLAAAVEMLAGHPGVGVFVELKRISIERFGAEAMLEAVLPALEPILPRCVPISFDAEILRAVRAKGIESVGWILESWDEPSLERARELAPCFVFVDREIPPIAGRLPESPWFWAVYAVNDAAEARDWAARGANFVETDAIGELLEDPDLAAWESR